MQVPKAPQNQATNPRQSPPKLPKVHQSSPKRPQKHQIHAKNPIIKKPAVSKTQKNSNRNLKRKIQITKWWGTRRKLKILNGIFSINLLFFVLNKLV